MIHAFHPEVVPGLPAHHRGRPPPRRADLRPDQPQRRARRRACTPGSRCGRRRRSPTRCSGRCPKAVDRRGDRRDRGRLRRPSPPAAGRVGSTASSCSARTARSCGASSSAPPTAAPTSTAAASRTGPGSCTRSSPRCATPSGRDLALGVRLCGDELIEHGITIDETVEVARAVEATRQGRLHQHLHRRGDRLAVHDRGVDARPARLRHVHPLGAAPAVAAAGRRRRSVQGSAPGRAGAGRGPRRPHRRGAWPDRRRGLRRQGTRRPSQPTSGSACRATRSASAAWASTAGWAASRTRAPARRPSRRHRHGPIGRSTCWWWAPGPPGSRPPSRRPGAAITSPSSSVRISEEQPRKERGYRLQPLFPKVAAEGLC